MVVSLSNLLLLVVVETALLAVVGVLAVVANGHGARARAGDARRLAHAQRLLALRVDGRGRGPLSGLPRRRRGAAVLLLVRDLAGADRARVAGWARRCGLEDDVLRQCRSRQWTRRLHAVRLLTALGTGADRLPELLRDPRAQVRAAATELVVEVGPSATAADLERLAQLLDDPAPRVRFAARDALCRLGQAVVRPLAAVLDDPAATPRLLSAALSVSAAAADPVHLPAASRLSAAADPRVRAGATSLLAALGGPEAAVRLLVLLDDPAPAVRAAAATGLGRLGSWAAAPAVGRCLRDPEWDVRRAAGLALAQLSAPGQLVLRRASADPEPVVADMARLVLAGTRW